jgi:hypothetical protein
VIGENGLKVDDSCHETRYHEISDTLRISNKKGSFEKP